MRTRTSPRRHTEHGFQDCPKCSGTGVRVLRRAETEEGGVVYTDDEPIKE